MGRMGVFHSLYFQRWVCCLGLGLVGAIPAAYADDRQPNCDMRQLDLTPIQKAKLRFIRMEHKNATDNTLSNAGYVQNARMNQIAHILTKPEFDDNQARRYVLEKYTPRMQMEVDELKVQHAFLQVLNPQQRQDWLRNCLR
ncbi:Spy/CpxP family protein refolding chaperone [Paralysiella testudinis]|uniref:Spy/CpxP family protein refolding chaperone n=1 Tax=Paralysiella testudinis TaxID=2809020 RepID=A0A892ZFE2_9NEIS|nr:Spy/CpxP family protein refolding chaperone [Paralysiella testudinis]QRQ81662.1 Spy/CpxP family protein refolding chaperone [Paralysiella testudinis]